MNLEDFKKEFDETIGKMSPQELVDAPDKIKADSLLIQHNSPAGPYWYHPDHPMCQDGQVLWEFPEDEE